ncbi:MAG: archaellin/type IV pilin N-terminal domain-containing protein [Nitrososphaerota archaeon]
MPGILMMYRGRSGISPVVATVILVAIAIVIAIAVAFWATGLVGIFTRYEKIEITAAYYDPQANGGGVVLIVRNTGSADATIDDVYVNGRPSSIAGFQADISGGRLLLTVGKNATITVTGNFVSGVTYELAVHTASGKLYPVAVLIP